MTAEVRPDSIYTNIRVTFHTLLMCDYDHVTIYWLPSNGAIIQCGRKAHAIKAGRTSPVQHSPMLSGGYAHKHNNEEGEPVTREIYIPWLKVLVFIFTLGTLIRVLLGT